MPTSRTPKTPQVEPVNIADLDRTPAQSCRDERRDSVVEEYRSRMDAGDKFGPVKVFRTKAGKLYLADGDHRTEARLLAGHDTIEAFVLPGGKPDAIGVALKANASHGLRRSNADKRACVQAALGLHPDRSDRAIAELCGVGHQLAGQVRSQLDESSSSQPRLGRDGKTRKLPSAPPPSEPDPELDENGYHVAGPVKIPPAALRSTAMEHAADAMACMQRIRKNDRVRHQAFDFVLRWIEDNGPDPQPRPQPTWGEVFDMFEDLPPSQQKKCAEKIAAYMGGGS